MAAQHHIVYLPNHHYFFHKPFLPHSAHHYAPEGTQKEFKLSTDISREDQKAAAKKLQADIERWDEEKRLKKEAEDKERKIQAAEDLARNVERSEARTVYEKSNDDWAGIRYGVEPPLLKRKLIKNKLPTRLG
jgi:hypothetical protein